MQIARRDVCIAWIVLTQYSDTLSQIRHDMQIGSSQIDVPRIMLVGMVMGMKQSVGRRGFVSVNFILYFVMTVFVIMFIVLFD